jgi:hypothetical protein
MGLRETDNGDTLRFCYMIRRYKSKGRHVRREENTDPREQQWEERKLHTALVNQFYEKHLKTWRKRDTNAIMTSEKKQVPWIKRENSIMKVQLSYLSMDCFTEVYFHPMPASIAIDIFSRISASSL